MTLSAWPIPVVYREIGFDRDLSGRQSALDKFLASKFGQRNVAVDTRLPRLNEAVVTQHCSQHRTLLTGLSIAGVRNARPRDHTGEAVFTTMPIPKENGIEAHQPEMGLLLLRLRWLRRTRTLNHLGTGGKTSPDTQHFEFLADLLSLALGGVSAVVSSASKGSASFSRGYLQ